MLAQQVNSAESHKNDRIRKTIEYRTTEKLSDIATNLVLACGSSAQPLHLMSLPTLLIFPERLGDGIKATSQKAREKISL